MKLISSLKFFPFGRVFGHVATCDWTIFLPIYSNFLDSALGRNPSLIWRSLCGIRDELSRVGNGEHVSVCKDSWLGCNASLQVESDRGTRNQDEKLSAFIDNGTKQ